MRWLKGVVINTMPSAARSTHLTIEVELETGRRAWATPHFKLNVREAVLVSWDYTNDRIDFITTKERLAAADTEQTQAEDLMIENSMIDVFQSPLNEELEGDLSDIIEPSSQQEPDREEENSMVDVFRSPLGDDVDCDSIVELRKDIKQ